MESRSFACPHCGSEHVTKLAAKHDRAMRPFKDGDTEPATTYAFQCQCGVGFTVTIRESEESRERAGELSRVASRQVSAARSEAGSW